MDLTQFVAAGGIVGLFAASSIVLFRSLAYESTITKRFQDQIDDLNEEIEKIKESNRQCAKANHILVLTLQRNNIEVPSEAWV